MMRRSLMVLAGCLAVSAGSTGARASVPDPGAHAITGVVQITLDSACPGEFKVPLAGSSTDGTRWDFVLDGFQIPCTSRYMVPVAYGGRYVPSAPPCDRTTGTGCPRSIDADRPGYISVGSLPLANVLQVTTVRFCVSGKCYQGTAILERAGGSLAQVDSAGPLVGAIAGLAEVTPPGCAPGALKMAISATTDGGPVWLSARPVGVAAECPDPVIGVTNVFVGEWSPNRGGCVSSVTYPGSSLCMSKVPYVLGPVRVGVAICFPGPSCWAGFATVVRT